MRFVFPEKEGDGGSESESHQSPIPNPQIPNPKSQEPFANHTAIVTGAARRLGRAIALALAENGADIVLHYGVSRAMAEETAGRVEAMGRRVVLVSADLQESVAAARAIAVAGESLGGADILVNSAAIFEDLPFPETSEELYDRHQAINLKAAFFLCQEFTKRLPRDRDGQILNLVDWRAARPPADYIAYTISKAGLLTLTKSLALQLAPRIRVNAIAPGAILPPPNGDFDQWRDKKLPAIPLQDTGDPQDIVEAALYLLSARFVTGEILSVTGGEELWNHG